MKDPIKLLNAYWEYYVENILRYMSVYQVARFYNVRCFKQPTHFTFHDAEKRFADSSPYHYHHNWNMESFSVLRREPMGRIAAFISMSGRVLLTKHSYVLSKLYD